MGDHTAGVGVGGAGGGVGVGGVGLASENVQGKGLLPPSLPALKNVDQR